VDQFSLSLALSAPNIQHEKHDNKKEPQLQAGLYFSQYGVNSKVISVTKIFHTSCT
jgi:hypothetical protein